jgi:hypothetical protein
MVKAVRACHTTQHTAATQQLAKAARVAYKRVAADARRRHEQQHLRDSLHALGHDAAAFWRRLQPPRTPCPITDLQQLRTHFDGVLNPSPDGAGVGTAAADAMLAELTQAANGSWRDSPAVAQRTEAAAELNSPITAEEVHAILSSLKNHKAADPHGLTAELLKYAVHICPTVGVGTQGAGRQSSGAALPASHASLPHLLAEPLAAVFQHIVDTGEYPACMTANDLTPILKKGDPQDVRNYRGIMVGSLFAKVYSAVWERRISRWAEREGLRSMTQFGFRLELGCVHSLFLLRHMVDKQRARQGLGSGSGPVYACLIDFKQAFDRAPRELLWRRMRERGVHGKALAAVRSMFDSVRVCVKSEGKRSLPFEASQGVKQGDPISPLLFGLFIELLSELLAVRAPGCGILVGGKRVRDEMFADDVTLVAPSAAELQLLLNVVAEFCDAWHVVVNVVKTHVIVFRHAIKRVQPCTVYYKGQAVQEQQQVVCLGLPMHATLEHPRFRVWEHGPLVKARRALFALQGLVHGHGMHAPKLQIRMFRALVLPVMSYACQLWAADCVLFGLRQGNMLKHPCEQLQLAFLRSVGCVRSSVHGLIILREFGVEPVHCYWLRVLLRFWDRVRVSHGVLRDAFSDDVALAVSGCTTCWASKVLGVLAVLGAGPVQDTSMTFEQRLQSVLDHQVEVEAACLALRARMGAEWEGLGQNPRLCASKGATLCAYTSYFAPGAGEQGACHVHCLDLRRGMHRKLMRFRMGCADIAVNTGRYSVPQVPRADRLCRVCGHGCVEDEKHVVFECVAYGALRRSAQFAYLFERHTDMRALFNDVDMQATLAEFVHCCAVLRVVRLSAVRNVVARVVVRRALARH